MINQLTIDIITDEGSRFLEFRELKALGVRHVMTTRDFDTGLSTCGEPARIEEQYRKILDLIGGRPESLWLLQQIHSTRVVPVTGELDGEVFPPGRVIRQADGLVTDEPGLTLATTFADCVPLVLYDPVHHALANLHSGWKGTLHQIGRSGLSEMTRQYGTKPGDVRVFIGPHIQAADFEVRRDLKDLFQKEFGEFLPLVENGEYIRPKDAEHWTIDLSAVIVSMFLKLGIPQENIWAARESTFARPDLFHSWRRDGQAFGLMSLVTVNP